MHYNATVFIHADILANLSKPAFPLIDWGGAAPRTSVRISARARSVRLRVLAPDVVELVLPARHSTQGIQAFVEQQRDWLIAARQRLHNEPRQAEPLSAPETLYLPALNERWTVDYRMSHRNTYVLRDERRLCVEHTQDDWPPILQRWLKARARQTLALQLLQLADELGFVCRGVTIRGQKTRWGSCSSKQVINLNWRLLLLAPEQVHYLMVHELCHTVHMNHSERFWALVERTLPGYRALDKSLRQAGRQIPAWARA